MAKATNGYQPARLADLKAVSRGLTDRGQAVTQEMTPSVVTQALMGAANGDIGSLQDLYLKMEATDARYSGLIQSLKSSVCAFPIRVKEGLAANGESARAKALIEDMLRPEKGVSMTRIMRSMTRAYVSGISIHEIMYSVKQGPDKKPYYYWTGLELVPPGRYRMDTSPQSKDYGQILISSLTNPTGSPLDSFPKGKLILMTDGSEKGFYDLGGAARRCLSWFLCKVYSQKWWAEYNEVYVDPLRIAHIPAGTSTEEKDEIEAFVKKLSRAMYAMLPDSVHIEFVQQMKDGAVKTYQDLISQANDEMSIAILGQIQTSDGGKIGSYAKAAIQNIVRFEIVQSIIFVIEAALAEIVGHLMAVNFGEDFDPAAFPTIRISAIRPGDALTKAETFNIASTMIPVPKKHIYDELGIPEPVDGEEVVFREKEDPIPGGNSDGQADASVAGGQADAPTEQEAPTE